MDVIVVTDIVITGIVVVGILLAGIISSGIIVVACSTCVGIVVSVDILFACIVFLVFLLLLLLLLVLVFLFLFLFLFLFFPAGIHIPGIILGDIILAVEVANIILPSSIILGAAMFCSCFYCCFLSFDVGDDG